MFADYSKITKIPKKQENNLILDFEGIDFLNTFEITELFAYLISFSFTGEIYKIENNSNVVSCDADRLDTLLKNIGLGDDSISSVIMSLFEVVDNAFSHNLGEI